MSEVQTLAITPEAVKLIGEGIREYNKGLPPTELVRVGNRLESVLPQEYHDNQWFRAIAYGLEKAMREA